MNCRRFKNLPSHSCYNVALVIQSQNYDQTGDKKDCAIRGNERQNDRGHPRKGLLPENSLYGRDVRRPRHRGKRLGKDRDRKRESAQIPALSLSAAAPSFFHYRQKSVDRARNNHLPSPFIHSIQQFCSCLLSKIVNAVFPSRLTLPAGPQNPGTTRG